MYLRPNNFFEKLVIIKGYHMRNNLMSIFIFCACLSASQLFPQQTLIRKLEKEESNKIKLHKIMSKTEYELSYEKKSNKKWKKTITYQFDQEGYEIKGLSFNDNGTSGIEVVKKYDFHGNKIEQLRMSWNNTIGIRWIYAYDDKGNLLTEKMYNYDGTLGHMDSYSYKYDGNNTIEEKHYDKNDKLTSTCQFIYERNKLLILHFDSNDSITTKETCIFDEKGQELECINYYTHGNFTMKMYSKKYDENGNNIEYCTYNLAANAVASRIKYQYEHNILKSKSFYGNSDKLEKSIRYEYKFYK
jgi:hypothetical protein